MDRQRKTALSVNTYRSVFHVVSKGWQLLKMKAKHPTEVDTMKKMLVQATITIGLGGHKRRMLSKADMLITR